MEPKPTAVEWLISQFDIESEMTPQQWTDLLVKAKLLERDNIESAFLDGDANAYRKEQQYKDEKDYFDKTYGT